MKTAKDIIKKRESLRLKAYLDPVGIPTIGWGHTKGVRMTWTCSEAQAELWLTEDMEDAYAVIDAYVTAPLTKPQREALCSFVFNVGPGRKGFKDGFVSLRSGEPSTMLRMLNSRDYRGAAEQFSRWVHGTVHGKKTILRGLVDRRAEERALFLSGTDINPEPIPALEEKTMSPLIIPVALELVKNLPAFAKIFQKEDVSERNVEAVVKATDIVVNAVGAANGQDAIEKIKADPKMAEVANDALRLNTADLLDAVERINAMEQGNIKAAREYNAAEPLMINTRHLKMRFIHILSLLFMSFSGTFVTVHWESLTSELKGAVITLMVIAGWHGVRDYWMGSSSGSDKKTDQLMR